MNGWVHEFMISEIHLFMNGCHRRTRQKVARHATTFFTISSSDDFMSSQ